MADRTQTFHLSDLRMFFRGTVGFIPGPTNDNRDTAAVGLTFKQGDVVIGSDGNTYHCFVELPGVAQWVIIGGSVSPPAVILADTNLNHTLGLADNGKTILLNGSVSNTITVPSSGNLLLPAGFSVNIIQDSVHQVAFVTDGGTAMINSYNNLTHLAGINAAASLIMPLVDVWFLIGNLA